MDSHTLQVLEYDKIKDLLGRHLLTDLGREVLDALHPKSDLSSAKEELRITSEARRALDELLEAPLDPVYDLRPLLIKVQPDASYLDPKELLQMSLTLKTTGRVEAFCRDLPPTLGKLRSWGQEIEPQPELIALIDQTIDDDARVKDSASRQLKAIRGSIREVQDWIVRRLNRMLRKTSIREILQEPYFTQREGRYVLPVQSKFKSHIKGIVHDCSDSGTTTFIEPVDIVDRGNRLRELKTEEELEVRKILRQISSQVRRSVEPIQKNLGILAQLDFAFAKGRLSALLNMQEPELAADGNLVIRQGCHPLLIETLKGKAIPLDITLGKSERTLVITGPNTGGKTVVLKTVGILCLMAASGLHIPARDGTRILIFPKIFADIGDEQSLEQSLSTFSSHINQVSRFLRECDEQTLVLIDELGTGTDPVEGGAIGVEILCQLHEKGAHTLITTHLNELKVFAYETPGIENAAMAFNQETLQPAYRLLPGTPGSSYALDIAARLGLPQDVIDKARQRLQGKKGDSATLLECLSNDLRQAEQQLQSARLEREKAEKIRLGLAQKLDRIDKEKDQILERSRHQARHILDDLQREIRSAEDRLSEIVKQTQQIATPEIKKSIQKIEEIKGQQVILRRKATKDLKPEREVLQWIPVEPNQLKAGQSVRLQGFTLPGELLSVDLKKQEAEVQFQSILIKVPLRGILGIVKPEEKPRPQPAPTTLEVSPTDELPHSIDIHGMTQDEAYPVLEKYIDAAHLAGWRQVYIIHGHGMGILRRMVAKLLEAHPGIESYRPGDYYEGGAGVTIAKLS